VTEVIALAGVRPEEVRLAAEAEDTREEEEAREDDDRESADGFGRDSRGASADVHGGPGPEGPEGGERGAGHCERGERDYEPDVPDERDRTRQDGGEHDEVEAGQLGFSTDPGPGEDQERRHGEGEAQGREGRVRPELVEEVPVRAGGWSERREVEGDTPPLRLGEDHRRRGEVGAREQPAVERVQRVAEEDPL